MLKCCAPNIVCELDMNDIIRQKILNKFKDLDLLTYTIEETERLEDYLYNSHVIDRGNIIEYELGELLTLSNLEGFLGHNPFIIACYQLAVNGLMRLAKKMKITFSNDFIDKWKNEPMLTAHIEDLYTASTDTTKGKAFKLPVELDTPRARKYIGLAIEKGFIASTDGELKWGQTKAKLAYFLFMVFCKDDEGKDNGLKFPESALNKLFGEDRLGKARTQLVNNKKQGYEDIDSLFD